MLKQNLLLRDKKQIRKEVDQFRSRPVKKKIGRKVNQKINRSLGKKSSREQ